MLTENVENPVIAETPAIANERPAWFARVLRIEWLGQTIASLCWIVSVFAYGISSTGDVLQLCAASSWLVANLAVAFVPRVD